MYQLSFSLEQFLQQYWQKKPTIIKGGFQNFQDPISPDEIAGLAMEEEIDSRFISNLNNEWHAEHGPFKEEKFVSLGLSHWSFIVQAVNHWHDGAAQLVEPFKVMPQWLFDDLMISYSVEGGGVGPHIDQYDVFIIQGSGKRHWRVGAKDVGQYTEKCRHDALLQIDSFEPILDDILEPGDILYIPPGFPHDGYALEPSMSYSIGFRSPKQQELLSQFADHVLANDYGNEHLHKPELTTQMNFGEISRSDLNSLTTMLMANLNNPDTIAQFIGESLSQSRHQLNIEVPQAWTTEELLSELTCGAHLVKVAGLRTLYHQGTPHTLFINGERYHWDEPTLAVPLMDKMAQYLCNQDEIHHQMLQQFNSAQYNELVCELVNLGYWYLAD